MFIYLIYMDGNVLDGLAYGSVANVEAAITQLRTAYGFSTQSFTHRAIPLHYDFKIEKVENV